MVVSAGDFKIKGEDSPVKEFSVWELLEGDRECGGQIMLRFLAKSSPGGKPGAPAAQSKSMTLY